MNSHATKDTLCTSDEQLHVCLDGKVKTVSESQPDTLP
jgi:hypothetical protein